jgi:RNA polymerase sigma factor (sigma-70 family)
MTAQQLKSMFLECRPALLRFLRARGAATDEAEDLLQDLFLKLEVQPTGPIAEPRAYLYRMADNLMLDRQRSAQRRARREGAWLEDSTNPAARATDHLLIAQEQLRQVGAALATLPLRTVEIFRRFRIDGERQKVIAADLGISVSAVEKHLQRAYDVVVTAKAEADADNEPPRRLIRESEHDVP